MKILVVDDDPSILQVLRLALRAMGFENVETAPSAMEAFDVVRDAEEPFDCILIDIQMPEIDGIELCEALREKPAYRRTPILMLTAMSEREYVERSFAAGASDYITKPFETVDLATRINLAERLHREIVSKACIERQLASLNQERTDGPVLRLEDTVSFDTVPGFLELPTFKNYLGRMERSRFRYGGVLAVKVADIANLYQSLPARDFLSLLTDMSDVVSIALRNERCHFTYAGAGNFLVLALSVPKSGYAREIGELIKQELARVELRYPSVGPSDINLSVGRIFGTASPNKGGVDAILEFAINDVEHAQTGHMPVDRRSRVS